MDDFPVMWAAPDTTARTLPWQLDPARQPKGYRTELVLTDRRLVILGVESGAGLAPAQELWSLPKEDVAGAERMKFSEGAADVRLRFPDGSWARLQVSDAAKLTARLSGGRRPVTEADITPEQRARIHVLMADPPLSVPHSLGTVLPVEEAPELERLTGDIVVVHLRVPLSNGSQQMITRYLDPSGADVVPEENR
ncbi:MULTISPECIES: hypothetical protein [unclassified Streptomyces]|uniref:hypothetical protein n=1 Tax=unclassified Streptomyces TaxID=2593676 RepID=UPI00136D30D5|nr:MULTISPECIES: hypothetical protein [unclassified Streptomyces]NEA01797.1 hypothetical protein [Streptomyces sp. SID10116]MYY85378.1 hypothetical protein [Streptomyces sp. SID335]MYZ18296.1 hypothetical protein [Streptomyces sp. SID337]NDZ87800.1 hypothetical protein [Streptomyces sp. SID10115]NEB48932.1 hypothetical protein [Streptomyces sp. SID339]